MGQIALGDDDGDYDDRPFGIPQGAFVRTESRKSRSKFLRDTL